MELGADGVEMDVQQTSDAGLVIHHDYMIDLHTDISGKIYDMTMGDLKTLDFGSWKDVLFKDEKIATLQEAMELCRQMPGCTVHLELKSTMDNDPDFVPRVLEVLQQTEMVEQVILVSFNHALLRQAKQLLPELRVGALVYGELESLLLPPPIIWKDLGLTNGMDEMEAMDTALPESAADEENCSWMTRWMSDKVSMLRASFPGESLNEIYKNLMAQRDLPAYIRSLDFVPEWVSCEYHTAYKNAGFIDELHEMGIKGVSVDGGYGRYRPQSAAHQRRCLHHQPSRPCAGMDGKGAGSNGCRQIMSSKKHRRACGHDGVFCVMRRYCCCTSSMNTFICGVTHLSRW